VPQVVVPHVGDQRYWADRLFRLGVAPSPLPVRRLTIPALAERLRAATDPYMQARARQLAMAMASERGTQAAIGLLERVAAG
jgi:UDP:flavonoid glycosyltransferase YjiC (YdhE family)